MKLSYTIPFSALAIILLFSGCAPEAPGKDTTATATEVLPAGELEKILEKFPNYR